MRLLIIRPKVALIQSVLNSTWEKGRLIMGKVNQVEQLEIDECARLIAITGSKNTIIVEGEPGTGKSSILKILQDMMGDKFEYVYVDCAIKDMGDVSMNIPVHESKELEGYTAS